VNTIDNNDDSESQDDSWMDEYFINTVSHNQTIPAKQANVNLDLGPNNTTRGPRGPWVAHLRKRSKVTVEPIIENPRDII